MTIVVCVVFRAVFAFLRKDFLGRGLDFTTLKSGDLCLRAIFSRLPVMARAVDAKHVRIRTHPAAWRVDLWKINRADSVRVIAALEKLVQALLFVAIWYDRRIVDYCLLCRLVYLGANIQGIL